MKCILFSVLSKYHGISCRNTFNRPQHPSLPRHPVQKSITLSLIPASIMVSGTKTPSTVPDTHYLVGIPYKNTFNHPQYPLLRRHPVQKSVISSLIPASFKKHDTDKTKRRYQTLEMYHTHPYTRQPIVRVVRFVTRSASEKFIESLGQLIQELGKNIAYK